MQPRRDELPTLLDVPAARRDLPPLGSPSAQTGEIPAEVLAKLLEQCGEGPRAAA